MSRERSCEVVVAGAGLAGLRAATVLAEAGVDTLVVEARERVGGRTCTEHLPDGGFIDHGGQWVSAGQSRIEALAADLGVALFPTWDDGATVDWRAGRRTTYTGLFAQPDPAAEAEVVAAATRLHEMAAQVPLEAPWTASKAAEWDDIALHQWLRDNVTSPAARALLARAIEGVFCAGPGRTSLLAALF